MNESLVEPERVAEDNRGAYLPFHSPPDLHLASQSYVYDVKGLFERSVPCRQAEVY
jgi:hypothetical protein